MATPSTQVRNDIESVVETHRLTGIEREKLTRIVTGAVTGNRDRPLYALAKSIQSHVASGGSETSLFDLLEPASGARKPPLPRLWLALLEFLATMDDYCRFRDAEAAVASLISGQSEADLSAAVRVFAASLHRYRVDHLPFEHRRQAFSAVRAYFSKLRGDGALPEDGDAIEFWCAMATSEAWTTYAATLAVLNDFVDAAILGRSAGEQSLDALKDKGFDPEADLFGLDSDAGPDLADAVETLSSAELKIFKGPEIEDLERLATAMRALRRWRRAGAAALSFTPVQNVLVQIKRQSATSDRLEVVARCQDAEAYGDKLGGYAVIEQICRDIAVLYRDLGSADDETSPRSSIADDETVKRIARIMRRQSFAKHPPDALRAEIRSLLPALATVATRLNRALGPLRAWPADGRDQAFEQDRMRFAETFRRLYCFQGS